MKISYIREMKRSCLVIETEEGEQRGQGIWEAGMLEENRIQGLLPMRVRYEEGREVYCYDITSRQPLGRILENHAITGKQVRTLFWQLYRLLEEMEQYLLDSGGLLLDPELIYTEPDRFEIGLCAVPGGQKDFAAELSHFLQYLLKHVDHRDRDCVVLAYGLYQESLKENYGMEDLVRIVADGGKEDRKESEPGDFRKDSGEQQRSERAAEELKNTSDLSEDVLEGIKEKGKEALPQNRGGRISGIFIGGAALIGIWGLTALAVWFFRGTDSLLKLSPYLAAGAAVSEILVILASIFRKTGEKGKEAVGKQAEKNRDEGDPWRILYEEEEEEDREKENRTSERSPGMPPVSSFPSFPENLQTTVLSGHPETEELHCLTSLCQEIPSIEIPYYPFVIGKHRELADYVLNHSTVSRFHLRLDRTEDRITITDLNSTNGTAVEGVLLAANETADLKMGDEVLIADLRFIWK